MSANDFQEQQRISMWWVWLAVFVPAAIMLNIFVQQIVLGQPHGEHPGPNWLLWVLTVFLCLCVPALLLILRLTVTVDEARDAMVSFCFVNDIDCQLDDEALTTEAAENFADACKSGFENSFTLSEADERQLGIWAMLCPDVLAEAMDQ